MLPEEEAGEEPAVPDALGKNDVANRLDDIGTLDEAPEAGILEAGPGVVVITLEEGATLEEGIGLEEAVGVTLVSELLSDDEEEQIAF